MDLTGWSKKSAADGLASYQKCIFTAVIAFLYDDQLFVCRLQKEDYLENLRSIL